MACLAAGGEPEDCGCVNGNEGMLGLATEMRGLGFQWGSYSNMAGCQVDACNTTALK